MQTQGVAILGSTGSIGVNALKVIEAFPDRFRVVALGAGANVQLLAAQIARHRPRVVSVATVEAKDELARLVDLSSTRTLVGEEGMVAVATAEGAAILVAAAVGAVGLVPTFRAIEAGRRIALANKETLVMAGELMARAARERGASILPVDSEHCALHQCLAGRDASSVKTLWLTASGGPFRDRDRRTFQAITVDEALRHPTWRMGRKITIDSATLMNKALEIIEARWLFGLGSKQIDVVVHPQSVVHSLVEFRDGTALAQLGRTDMRIPIQYALTYPDVLETPLEPMNFRETFSLHFEPPDHAAFPSLGLAHRALELGGTTPAAFNAANEVAVAAFLEGRITFPRITEAAEHIVSRHAPSAVDGVGTALAADREARARTLEFLAR